MEGSLDQSASLLRADLDEQAYVAFDDPIACHLVPSVVGKSSFRYIAPEMRELGSGVVQVKLSDDVRVKDRLVVGERLFEIVAPVTPDSREWIRRLIVREIRLPERALYLALKTGGHDTASNADAVAELIKVLPHAYIVDRPIEVVEQGDKNVIVHLKQYEVSEIARAYFTDEIRARLLHCLVVSSDVTPTVEQANDGVFTPYRFGGSLTLENYKWGNDFGYRVMLTAS